MAQERAFLDEITANPEYRMARLVYADWLEEKGDARRVDPRRGRDVVDADLGRPLLAT